MAGRSLARVLAPLSLVAVCVALFLVFNGSLDDRGSTTGTRSQERRSATSSSSSKETRSARSSSRRQRRSYVVKAGDTPGAIAESTGVPLSQILELNPEIDPQTLAPGTRLRLRR